MEVLQRTANRGSVSTGYDIENSCKFEADNSESMARTNSSEGNKQICTLSMWVKRTELSDAFYFTAGDTVNPWFLLGFYQDKFYWTTTAGQSAAGVMQTNRVFRDTSAWYHFVLAIDTTQGTDTNRYKLYVNGVQETSFGTANYPSQNANLQIMEDLPQDVGGYTSYFFSGYLAEFVAIDGQALAPTEFGEFDADSGIWKPIDVSGLTFGTNGFYLDFKDSANLGNDASGGTDFTLTNISAADQAQDSPTCNFATLNPLHLTTRYTITEGGTNQVSSANGWGASVGSVGVTSGKWYFEVQSDDTNGYTLLGVIDEDSLLAIYINGDAHAGDAPYGITYYGGGGSIITNGSAVTGLSFPTWTTETMGCALDLDNNKIYFSKSGTYGNSGNPATGANGVSLPTGGSGTWFISTSTYYAAYPAKTNQGGYTGITISSAASDSNNFGTFEYAPPTGYYALCTKNLAEYG